ncbi:hypothetical protein ACRAWF_25810 [Streptomyces sp. L7]
MTSCVTTPDAPATPPAAGAAQGPPREGAAGGVRLPDQGLGEGPGDIVVEPAGAELLTGQRAAGGEEFGEGAPLAIGLRGEKREP